jgi:hypothetical protein
LIILVVALISTPLAYIHARRVNGRAQDDCARALKH